MRLCLYLAILETEVSENGTRIDVPCPSNSNNDEIVARELAKDFNEAFSKWEHNAARAESYQTSQQPSVQIEDERTFDLNLLCKQVNDSYERLRQIQTPDQDIVRKVDICDVLTRSLQRKLESYLSSLEKTAK